MRVLLDSHIMVWWFAGSKRLGKEAAHVINSSEAELYVSAASWWELSIKKALGRLDFDLVAARQLLAKNEIKALAVTLDHADIAATLPAHHGDPFDRMLVAQAKVERLILLTRDRHLESYGEIVLCV